ncbi:MAG: DUF58 domain-containing protein [Planctomycetota bacterium]|jgi:uncharacterized protein (DUF58 family)
MKKEDGVLSLILSRNVDGGQPVGGSLGYFWNMRFTEAGQRLIIVTTIAGAVAAVFGINIPVYYYAILLFSMFLSARLIGFIFRPRVLIERELPERVSTGAEITVSADVINKGIFPVFDLAVSENHPPEGIELSTDRIYVDCIQSGDKSRVEYSITAQQRGIYDFRGPIALSFYPYGLFTTVKRVESPHRMLVYPAFNSISAIDVPVGRKHQPGGLQMVSHTGDSEEFLGNREYVTGDRQRDIDQKAWARVGKPIIREFQQEYLCRIALIVDTFIPSGAIDSFWEGSHRRAELHKILSKITPNFVGAERYRTTDELEAAISLGASIADALSRQEYVIDIFAAGPELYHFQAGRSLAHLDNILDVLACIEACPVDPFAKLGPALSEEISEISTAIVVMLDWDEVRENFIRSILNMGVAVKLIVVKNDETTVDVSGFRSEAGPATLLRVEDINNGIGRL